MAVVKDRHPVSRIAQLCAGVLLIVAAPIASPLPGPGGILLFAGGLVLVLRNSHWARVRWARLKRGWPRTGHLVDRAMRRPSALRRHARTKAERAALTSAGPSPMRTPTKAVPVAALFNSVSGMNDEADLSAEQPGAGTPSRLPLADGDGRRPLGDSRSPQPRPQEAVGLIRQPLSRLTRRSEYLAANAGRRAPMPGFVLLVKDRGDGDPTIRYGITVSKKVGNAVVRNRMKRRFRELARSVIAEKGVAGADHVLIGRQNGIERDWDTLGADLTKALGKLKPRTPAR